MVPFPGRHSNYDDVLVYALALVSGHFKTYHSRGGNYEVREFKHLSESEVLKACSRQSYRD